MLLLDAILHYDHVKAIRCNIKPESVEGSRNAEKWSELQEIYFTLPTPNKNQGIYSGITLYPIFTMFNTF
jgi:hypothetical protein